MDTNTLRGAVTLALVLSSCTSRSTAPIVRPAPLPPGAEAMSLLGEPLFPPPLAADDLAKKEADLAAARAAHERAPGDAEALIWYGRRLAYLGRYRDAVAVFGDGIAKHSEDPRMYRHRGHRWITLRQFERALADLERAAELVQGRADEPEPPGTPNARGVMLDTLKQNVYYHLALAHYLRGEFEAALPAWEKCAKYSNNDDSLCSVTHWTYMTLRRLGREAEARGALEQIRPNMDIIEYHGYHALVRMYRGEIDADELLADTPPTGKTATDFATIGYGVGNWHLYNSRPERAREVFRQVIQTPMWAAFGCIASEVELTPRR